MTREDAPPPLYVDDVHKSYGDHVVLRGIGFTLEPGEIHVLLGPNGAGKTTLISCIAGLRPCDRGTVFVNGTDMRTHPSTARESMGLASQETSVYPTVSVADNLRLFASLAGISRRRIDRRIEALADALGLSSLLGRQARFLSGGERRRLHTALALVNEPRLLLLDEPTVGADIETREALLAYVRSLADAGTSILYTTHYLPEIHELGEHVSVAILAGGRIAASGSVASLVAAYAQPSARIEFETDVPDALCTGTGDDAVRLERLNERAIRVFATAPAAAAVALVNRLDGGAGALRSLEVDEANLESVYRAVVGEHGHV